MHGPPPESTDERLLIEIYDIAGDLDENVVQWIDHRMAEHSAGVQAWLAVSDDSGPLGDGRNRVVLLHDSYTGTASSADVADPPAWLTAHHTYGGATVNCLRTDGRPDPVRASAIRLVAMNCADDAQDEFDAWYRQDHLPRFAAVPGVLEARQLRCPTSQRRQLALYRLDSADAVSRPEWKAAADTPWTVAMRDKTFDRDRITAVPIALQEQA